MIAAGANLLAASLARLATTRPVFHSEADFQHALAWQIQLDEPGARIRLETRPFPGRAIYLDLAVVLGDVRIAIELKYLVKALSISVDGEDFALPSQSAHDVRRYDTIKDLCRVEELIAQGVADVGVVVALTNDPAYWKPGQPATIDPAFRIGEGRSLAGRLVWAAHAGAGTTVGRNEELALRGTYPLRWADYSDLGVRAGAFRYLLIEAHSAAGVERRG